MVQEEVGLLRRDVEELLRHGMRWRVSYCWGAHSPDECGSGLADLPAGVLNRVPNQSAARKLAAGRTGKTYFFAHLAEDGAGPLLPLAEP